MEKQTNGRSIRLAFSAFASGLLCAVFILGSLPGDAPAPFSSGARGEISALSAYETLSAGEERSAPARAGENDGERLYALGGMPFGVRIRTRGAEVFRVEEGSAAQSAGFLTGDRILTVNGRELPAADISTVLRENAGKKCVFTVRRGEKDLKIAVKAPKQGENLGLYLRDTLSGIGTVCFYEPESGAFAGLGHGICAEDSPELLPLLEGGVYRVRLTTLLRGQPGAPGQLRGVFLPGRTGEVRKNAEEGVFGVLDDPPADKEYYPLARAEQVKPGRAEICCTVQGNKKRRYGVEIEKILRQGSGGKNYLIRVTDPELLSVCGGIVQGMSGSPILQDGRIVGAVTHVLIGDPTRGYAICAERMERVMNRLGEDSEGAQRTEENAGAPRAAASSPATARE